MKTYEAYKESGVDWIGEIPEHWVITSLRFLTNYVKTGSTPPTENKAYYNQGDIPWYGPADFNSLTLTNAKKQVSQKAVDDGKCRIFDKNSILLIGIGATVGKVGITTTISSANQQINAISFDQSKMKASFALYFLTSIKRIIVSKADSATLPIFNQTQTKELRLVKPSQDEQTQIAKYLDHKTAIIDALMEKKEQLIQKLQAQRQAIINEAVTKGLNPNTKMKDSGIEWLGEIPENWKVSNFKYFISLKGRLGWKGLKAEEYVENSGYGFLSTPDIKSKNIDFKKINNITKERYDESPEIMLEEGDVLLVKDGSTLGITNIVKQLPIPCTVNSSIGVLRIIRSNDLNSQYLLSYLRTSYIQAMINLLKAGQGVPHLFQKDINNFSLILPPLKEQLRITEFLEIQTSRNNSLINKLKSQIKKLISYRQSIINEAVTGKVDVRDWQAPTKN